MQSLRTFIRFILFISITIFLGSILVVGGLLFAFSPRQVTKLQNRLVRTWGKSMAFILNAKIIVNGKPPEPPFFLVSNHVSYMDIPMYFTALKCVFVAKQEVSGWPLLGYLAKKANTLFIDRENRRDIKRVNQLISENITDQHGVIVFPEGTSSGGQGIMPYKPSTLQFPATEKMPVHYAHIHYNTHNPKFPPDPYICWYGDMTFADHLLRLFSLPKFTATITFGKGTQTDDDRKVLAQKLWDVTNKNFIPLQSTEEKCLTSKA